MTGLDLQQRVTESQERKKRREEQRKKLEVEVAKSTARMLLDMRAARAERALRPTQRDIILRTS